ncbi:uncharacterized protein [Cherax quadricarinatus]|uniref:uncharacterized protein isoform X3 n=1 Tax=Cherax quadricarinatus TaxID=27406 RepID=UPI00387E49DC
MLRYIVLATLVGSACAATLTLDQELYVVAGILGGVCLLLTIAAIYNTVTIISIQSNLRILRAKTAAALPVIIPQPEEISLRNPYGARDEFNRRPPPQRENYKMERISNDYYRDSRYGGPAPPPRPLRQDTRNSGYY